MSTSALKRESPRARRAGRRWLPPPGLALFLVLAGIYLLTSGGHTYSYDEETMFGLTESIVERGSFVVPTCGNCTVLRSIPMPEGRNYSRYGVVQSLVAIPAYVVGRALAGEDDGARWFGTRFAATLVDALVTAGIGALLYGLVRRLGYGHGIALAGGLVYGLGTQAWPRAKTFFADPLTTLLILGAVYCWWRLDNPDEGPGTATSLRPAVWWAVGIGLCCGLAIGTKFGAGIIVPILGLAGAASLWRRWRGGLALRDVATMVGGAALALAVPVALVGLYNWVRFGSPLETGYGGSEVGAVQQGDFWGGFSGLVYSPGKGLLLFSPPVILGLLAWWPFARRHLRLALVAGALVIAHVVFYARVPQWDGGTCWGPRYLDFIVPLLILPLPAGLAWLAQRGRAVRLVVGGLAAAVLTFAIVVQLLGVLVNFDTGYNRITTGRRYWTPGNSPPLVHAQILRERVAEWWAIRFPSEDSVIPDRAIVPENEAEPIWPRYLPRETTLRVHANGSGPVVAMLTFEDARARRDPPQRFTITVNGRVAGGLSEVAAPEAGPNVYRLSFTLRGASEGGHDFQLTIRNELFDLLGPSRTLSVEVSNDGTVVPLQRPPAILGFPGDTPERWAWFFSERNQHLVDLWPWYVAFANLPVGFSRLLVFGVGGGGIVALVVGAGCLIRYPRSGSRLLR